MEASCHYKSVEIDGKTGFRLSRVVVEAPTAFFGHVPGQTVGWRVIVQRSYPNNDGPLPANNWKSVYISRLRTSVASPDQAAVLAPITARIGYISYFDSYPDGVRSWFKTIVKFYRFTPEGAVETQTRHKIQSFLLYDEGELVTRQYGICDGSWLDSTTGGPPEPH